ncbi:MAG: FkbM family methyltransferase [Acidimicrobiales bacterium]
MVAVTERLLDRLDAIESRLEQMEQRQHELAVAMDRTRRDQAIYMGNSQALTRLYTGQKIFVDTRDVAVSPALLMDGVWEMDVTEVFLSILRPSDVVLDVGANMGYFGIVAGTIVNASAGGSIHLIEANPELIPLLFKSVIVSGMLSTASVTNLAVTDHRGEVELYLTRDLMGSASLDTMGDRAADALDEKVGGDGSRQLTSALEIEGSVTVPAATIDDFVESRGIERVDVLKLDIEGAEEPAYAGMHRTIDRNRERLKLLIEYAPVRYRDPEGFYEQITRDFSHRYAIRHGSGELVAAMTLERVLELTEGEWVMLVVANQPLDGS